MKDHYKTLGVSRNASEEEIKKAYRRLAHQCHPDKPGGDERKFKEINEAYQVLGNRKRREQYDRFGTPEPFSGTEWGASPQGEWDFGDFSRGGGPGTSWGYGDVGDLSELFESFFEGLGVRSRRRPTYERGSDLEVIEEITLEEAFRGTTKRVAVETFIPCGACSGHGGDLSRGVSPCAACNGEGEIREHQRSFFGSFSQVKACRECHGTGKVPNKMCSACRGSGRVEGERWAEVEILPGVQNNQIIKIKGAGEAGERGTAAGDLYVRVKTKPHPIFERRGDDLVVKKELSVLDLLLGRKIGVPTIGGGKLHVEVPAHFNLKEDLKIPGEGMPHMGSFGRGDLLVSFIVKAPKKLSGEAKKLLEELEKEKDSG